ncbi:hypothetical protein VE01_05744 [Pseudogymnoascus verrucosus]|uniref:Uncharacterized protein n=1 Tax=Pseudogymnoascus verrucosus TaxID=342668 RepID=A0A1B8GKM8_9PEZI|nr:uncharacterized protein VE01_05744 [Pseudogymnoascus verrucosus]OBT96316.1 hypothetical protein VE01_05744 [Pseudogymnoascus verrucosus]
MTSTIFGSLAVSSVDPLNVFSEAQAFFETRLGPRKGHAKNLVRAFRGFLESIDLDPEDYRNIWSARSEIFLGSGVGPIARFHRLYDGLVRIKRGREDYDCASRLWHIFLEHDLEQLVRSGSFKMSRGRGKKTAALCAQAESISSTVASVKADRKTGRCYLQLLRLSSPGLLLLIGSHVNTVWERKLSKEDIPLLLHYLRVKQPEVMEKARMLDKIAARLIVDGFIAYGWTYSELNDTRAKLLDQLRLYINLPWLSQREEEKEFAAYDITSLAPSTSNNVIHDEVANSEGRFWDDDNANLADEMIHTPQLQRQRSSDLDISLSYTIDGALSLGLPLDYDMSCDSDVSSYYTIDGALGNNFMHTYPPGNGGAELINSHSNSQQFF